METGRRLHFLSTLAVLCLIHLFSFIVSVNGVQVSEFKSTFLSVHNHLRRSVYPPARDMVKLEWNQEIADFAKTSAAACKADHTGYQKASESIYTGTFGNVTQATMMWFMERIDYDIFNPEKCPFTTCGHYLLMVRSKLTHIGCAMTTQKCLNGLYVAFCEYQSKLPQKSAKIPTPYRIGKPCSACPEGYEYCDKGLCVKKGQGACTKTCKNCAPLDPKSCRCVCPLGYSGDDCSIRDTDVPDSDISQCKPCTQNPPICSNGGTVLPGCSKCSCKSGYSGDKCEYITAQIQQGVLLKFNGDVMSDTRREAYYPIDVYSWPKLLSALQTAIVDVGKKICKRTISESDVIGADGFPWLDGNGILRALVLVRGDPCATITPKRVKRSEKYMPQADLLKVLESSKTTLNDAVKLKRGVSIKEIKIPSTEDLMSDDYRQGTSNQSGSNAGTIAGAIIGTLLILLVLAIIGLLVFASLYPKKIPVISSKLPWLKNNQTSASSSRPKGESSRHSHQNPTYQ